MRRVKQKKQKMEGGERKNKKMVKEEGEKNIGGKEEKRKK